MGFFSSIGKVFKKVAAPVAGVLGGVLGGPAGAVAGATMADAVWGNGSSGSSNSDWYKSSYADQMAFAREQFDFNKQYIQNQLQWRVDDAKKAGLHPMAVLGLNGASFSPVSSPSIPSLPESTYDPSELGQSVAYAATKAKTNKQQEQAFNMAQATAGIQMEGLELDNEYKRLQIMDLVSRMSQTGPAAPDLNGGKNLIGGQNDSPSSSSLTSGVSPLMGASRVGNSLFLHLNPDIADSITEDFVRNMVANIAAEGSIPRMYAEIARRFSKEEQEALKRGDAELRYVGPSQIQFLWRPHMRPKYSSDKKSVSGRLRF